jgi:hypothetical protein
MEDAYYQALVPTRDRWVMPEPTRYASWQLVVCEE